ncbi:MAG: aldehyde dehydrogenase family protein [Actinomycetota bacterium]|nr:aldehyde dehydrogenase family protein [Actinomycetota bacterium]
MTSLHETTPATDHGPLVAQLRATFDHGVTRPLDWRRAQLQAMAQMLSDGEAEFLEALAADLGKPAIEGWMTELRHVQNEIHHILDNLAAWAAPERVRVRAMLRPSKASIVPEPLGVALVIAPWNYPLHLLLLPMAYALAAGNAVVGKPSEITSRTAAALARWVPRYLDEAAVAIVEGDAPVVTSLLKERWDHIFYTGNGTVGRIVMEAAAKNLTPVTLELGGKSPTIIDRSANLGVAARRVAWGKFVNAGQTCVAPDYVLVDRSVEGPFVDLLAKELTAFYGSDPKSSADLTRIVSDRHFDRLQKLLDGRSTGRVVVGGDSDRSQRYLAPTVLSDVSWDEALMTEEIFGPILPVLAVDGLDEAIAQINAHDKPLALYMFSEDQAATDRVIAETSSGGVCVNGTLLQLAVTDLPFGGVGESGMGAYHGKTGFDAFTHRKAVFQRGTRPDPAVMYPPYGRVKQWLLRRSY